MSKTNNVSLTVLIMLIALIFNVGIANASSDIPVFYDDFSDGRLYDRTGVDPWNNSLPQWDDAQNQWYVTNGSLGTMVTDGWCGIQSNFAQSVEPYGTWEWDYQFANFADNPPYKIAVNFLLDDNGNGYMWGRVADGHNYLYARTPEGLWHLLGWNAPTQSPSGANDGGDVIGTGWHHVKIIRYRNGTINVWEDNELRKYQEGLAAEDEDNYPNQEIYDNPSMYTPNNGAPNWSMENNATHISISMLRADDSPVGERNNIDNIVFYASPLEAEYVNSPPFLDVIGNKSVHETSILEFTIAASDSDGDSLTYSASNLPTGSSFDSSTHTFSWTPNENQAGQYSVHFEVTDGSLTDAEDITITVIEVAEQQASIVLDNRLRESSPDAVLEDSTWIDVGRIDGAGNYRGTIWFNLSQYNSTDHIDSAKLSLFWYYENRNQSTDINIYRPDNWDSDYVTWNSRTNGVTWNNAGGDWYDRNNLGQGTEAYATVTFPVDATPDYTYHDFDVTELVQSYVNGTYDNTGFFIKANEVDNTYIAFYSSDWANVNQQPKLTISHVPQGDEPAPDIFPTANAGPDHTVTIGDSITFDGSASSDDNGIVSYVWDFDVSNGLQQDATGEVVSHSYETAGTYTVTLSVTDTGGNTDTDTAVVTVLDASSSSSISILPSSSLVAPGETFTVDVTVSPDEPIIGAQFNLNFDSSLVTVNSVTEGNLFSQEGASTYFSSGTIDNIDGTVTNVYGSILGESSVSSEGVLATITLTAGGSGGVSALDISNAIISDVNSNSASCAINDATVRINSPPSVTSVEPAQGAVFDETDVIAIDVTASDADEQSLSYTIKIDDVICGTGSSYSWVTDYTSAGSHTIDVIVSDGISETTAQRTITINNVHPRWDVNEDGTVDVLDLTTIGQQYGTSIEEPYPRWDVNQDGVVNILDMTITSSHFGETGVE